MDGVPDFAAVGVCGELVLPGVPMAPRVDAAFPVDMIIVRLPADVGLESFNRDQQQTCKEGRPCDMEGFCWLWWRCSWFR